MNDDGPVRYYAYDRDSKEATFLFEHQPALSQYELASMEPFSYTAGDGLTIHGYLTFPSGAERRDLPTVLNVHGGPWARDQWGYNPEAQWLANRGYLCIQVNFRGSTGYGKRFLNARDREWGARMHDDLIDGLEWVLGQGYADRERVAIYGGSYGGYAALVGATFTPDVFRCAVDVVGPSNLKTLIETTPPYWKPMIAQLHRRVGHPERDADFLWSRSPLSRVDQIRIPAAHRSGRQRPPGQAGGVGADRGSAPGQGHPSRVPAVPRRGTRLRQAGEPSAFLRRRRAVPGPAPRRPLRGMRPGAGLSPLRIIGGAQTFTQLVGEAFRGQALAETDHPPEAMVLARIEHISVRPEERAHRHQRGPLVAVHEHLTLSDPVREHCRLEGEISTLIPVIHGRSCDCCLQTIRVTDLVTSLLHSAIEHPGIDGDDPVGRGTDAVRELALVDVIHRVELPKQAVAFLRMRGHLLRGVGPGLLNLPRPSLVETHPSVSPRS